MTAGTVLEVPIGALIHRRSAVGTVKMVERRAWRFYRGIEQSCRETPDLQVTIGWHGTESITSVPLTQVRAVGDEFYVVD